MKKGSLEWYKAMNEKLKYHIQGMESIGRSDFLRKMKGHIKNLYSKLKEESILIGDNESVKHITSIEKGLVDIYDISHKKHINIIKTYLS